MDILTSAPWWVYVLFLFLLRIGIRATRYRTLSLKRLYLLPSIFTLWNIGWLVERTQEQVFLVHYWIAGLGVGTILGWLTVCYWIVHADRQRKLINIPGSWSTLILIVLVFTIRYYFIANYHLHPELAPRLYPPDAFISGIATGIFIGRSLELYRKYRQHRSDF